MWQCVALSSASMQSPHCSRQFAPALPYLLHPCSRPCGLWSCHRSCASCTYDISASLHVIFDWAFAIKATKSRELLSIRVWLGKRKERNNASNQTRKCCRFWHVALYFSTICGIVFKFSLPIFASKEKF